MKNNKFKILSIGLIGLVGSFFTSCESSDDATGYSTVAIATDNVISVNSTFTSPNTVLELNETFTYTVSMSTPQVVDVHVKVMQTAGTAVSGEDFDFSHEVVIPAGATSGTGEIMILADIEEEDMETFTLQVGGESTANAVSTPVNITFNIENIVRNTTNFNGNYVVTLDQWADYSVGDVVPVEYDSALGLYKFKILSTNNPYIDNPTTSYMLVTVDPVAETCTVQSNEDFAYTGWQTLPVTGDGTVNFLDYSIDLTLAFGSNTGYGFKLEKQ